MLEHYEAKISWSPESVTFLMWLSTTSSYQYFEGVPVDLVAEVQLVHERTRLWAPGCVQSPVATVHSLYHHQMYLGLGSMKSSMTEAGR